MPVVVVESPAKAKTINGYLGSDYTVLASYGHVRDLVGKDGSVDTEAGFEMTWEVPADSKKHIKAIADALADDDQLILATDPDREGEAISWHLQEALTKRRAIKKDTAVSRVAFNAITKKAVQEAIANPRDIDTPLVHAYLARRALDYLVGFTLSPVLWRKLPGSKSAGRVQSVSLRLVVEREMEIEAFDPQEYWSVRATLETPRGQAFEARLVTLSGRKIDRLTLTEATQAELAVRAIESRDLSVRSVEAKPGTRNPSPPFMTSTLQQEASRKFGMGARACMSAAQRLYEAGLITYMRTDGIDMAPEAVHAARDAIKDRYGADYVPGSPRMYKNKAKNAQEAHECIRPTDMTRSAEDVRVSEADQKRLYDLIWKRTLASQMEAAKLERTTVSVGSADGEVELRATGQVVVFDGFMKVYTEGRDDDEATGDDKRLPQIHEGDAARKAAGAYAGETSDNVLIRGGDGGILGQQHFAQPPPRYTEATLVKRMEELGIGRPSTYASILKVLQDRGYVTLDKRRFTPVDKGRLVTAFLEEFFPRYVQYDYTADVEEDLDKISAGNLDWKRFLRDFWEPFAANVEGMTEMRTTAVLDALNVALAPLVFPPREDGTPPRECPKCTEGELSLKVGRYGSFVGCSRYPECKYTRPFGQSDADASAVTDDAPMGTHPDTGRGVFLKSGRFGPYVEMPAEEDSKDKPKRASIPKGWNAQELTFEQALQLINLPRDVGMHPETKTPIVANFGRYGPYVLHDGTYANLPDQSDVFEIGLNRAVTVLAEKRAGGGGRGRNQAKVLKDLGKHPSDDKPVQILDGRYGPYVKYDKINATIPRGTKPEDVNIYMALEYIAEKEAKSGKKKPAKKKAAAKKNPAAKKKPAARKKPAAKKKA